MRALTTALLLGLALSGCGTLSDSSHHSRSAQAGGTAEVCMKGKEASFDDVATLLFKAGFTNISACSEREGRYVAEVSYYDCDCSKDLFRVRITVRDTHRRTGGAIDLSSTGPKKPGETDSETAHRLLRRDDRLYTVKIALANL